jgi:bifunctional ADP-heptose synthase (sugar kinase/adenylyltransferase)
VRFKEPGERLGGARQRRQQLALQLGARTQLLSVHGSGRGGRPGSRRLRAARRHQGEPAPERAIPTDPLNCAFLSKQQLLRIDFEDAAPRARCCASKLADSRRALPACNVVILSDYGKGGCRTCEE